ERDIDEGDGRLEEVVVVPRHELPDLVDERAEADAAQDGREFHRAAIEIGDQEENGRGHHQAAPEHVADVEEASAELRITGQTEHETNEQNRGHGGGQEGLDMPAGVEVAQGAARGPKVGAITHKTSVRPIARSDVGHRHPYRLRVLDVD